jgi:hypothetical protein
MNKTLVGVLNVVNTVLAIAVIVGCTAVGYIAGPAFYGDVMITSAVGLVVGVVLASVVCGLLALLLEIERNLRRLVQISEGELSRVRVPGSWPAELD